MLNFAPTRSGDGSVAVGAAWARTGAFLDILERHLLADGLVAQGVNA